MVDENDATGMITSMEMDTFSTKASRLVSYKAIQAATITLVVLPVVLDLLVIQGV